jgi:hypothetical protein
MVIESQGIRDLPIASLACCGVATGDIGIHRIGKVADKVAEP